MNLNKTYFWNKTAATHSLEVKVASSYVELMQSVLIISLFKFKLSNKTCKTSSMFPLIFSVYFLSTKIDHDPAFIHRLLSLLRWCNYTILCFSPVVTAAATHCSSASTVPLPATVGRGSAVTRSLVPAPAVRLTIHPHASGYTFSACTLNVSIFLICIYIYVCVCLCLC